MDRSTSARRGSLVLGAAVLGGLVLLPGCARVRQAVADVLPGGGAATVDAHSVYRLRPGCATVAARTVRNGYTILTPADTAGVRVAGLFEGPALVGSYVFRYVPPTVGETWDGARADAASTETTADVAAVGLDLPDVRVWMDRLCGPLPPGEGETGDAIPRIPGQRP